jgi:hypothetical protein
MDEKILSTETTFLLDMQHFTRHRAHRGRRNYSANSRRGGAARVGLYRRPMPAEYSTEYLRSVLPDERIEFRAGATVTTTRAVGPWSEMEPTFVIFDEADVTGRPRVESPEESYDAMYRCLPTGRLG